MIFRGKLLCFQAIATDWIFFFFGRWGTMPSGQNLYTTWAAGDLATENHPIKGVMCMCVQDTLYVSRFARAQCSMKAMCSSSMVTMDACFVGNKHCSFSVNPLLILYLLKTKQDVKVRICWWWCHVQHPGYISSQSSSSFAHHFTVAGKLCCTCKNHRRGSTLLLKNVE